MLGTIAGAHLQCVPFLAIVSERPLRSKKKLKIKQSHAIEFTDWNPATNAGTYDWFWEVSINLGGDTVPYHRLAHLIATETTTKGWLRVRVTFYNEMNCVLYEFDYETPWILVIMPDIPSV